MKANVNVRYRECTCCIHFFLPDFLKKKFVLSAENSEGILW